MTSELRMVCILYTLRTVCMSLKFLLSMCHRISHILANCRAVTGRATDVAAEPVGERCRIEGS